MKLPAALIGASVVAVGLMALSSGGGRNYHVIRNYKGAQDDAKIDNKYAKEPGGLSVVVLSSGDRQASRVYEDFVRTEIAPSYPNVQFIVVTGEGVGRLGIVIAKTVDEQSVEAQMVDVRPETTSQLRQDIQNAISLAVSSEIDPGSNPGAFTRMSRVS